VDARKTEMKQARFSEELIIATLTEYGAGMAGRTSNDLIQEREMFASVHQALIASSIPPLPGAFRSPRIWIGTLAAERARDRLGVESIGI
jgi:hypothetical protein